jgi:hypothetical protein
MVKREETPMLNAAFALPVLNADPDQLRVRRLGEKAACKNCLHAYPLKVSLKDSVIECRQQLGTYVAAVGMSPQGQIVAIAPHPTPIPRTVAPDYFCSQFVLDRPLADA